MIGPSPHLSTPLQLIPKGTRVEVFNSIYWVFLGLGTLVGVVVISYMLYNAYKYRDGSGRGFDESDSPQLGELPQGGGKGKKLFTSFALSAIIVSSLIVWTYGTLLYVEGKPAADVQQGEDPLTVRVEGFRFGWKFHYPNGNTTTTLRVPEDRTIKLKTTSEDVWHNFGIPALRVKTDAIPGEETTSWFEAKETGNYTANCYELCGTGHSVMEADVIVMTQEEFQAWYSNTTADDEKYVLDELNNQSDHDGEGSSEGGSSGGGHDLASPPAPRIVAAPN